MSSLPRPEKPRPKPFRPPLGSILLSRGAISQSQLDSALKDVRQFGVALGQVLIRRSLCTDDEVLSALGQQHALPIVHLDKTNLDPSAVSTLGAAASRRLRVVVFGFNPQRPKEVMAAFPAPASLVVQDEVRSLVGRRIHAVLASDRAIERALDRAFREPAHVVAPLTLEEDLAESRDGERAGTLPIITPATPGAADALLLAHLSPSTRARVSALAAQYGVDAGEVLRRVVESWNVHSTRPPGRSPRVQ